MKKIFKSTIYLLIFSMILAAPSFAAKKENEPVLIQYDKIEDMVKKQNLQIKLNEISLDDMKDALDSADDAEDGIRNLQRTIYTVSDGLNAYTDPVLGPLAQAIQFSLELSSSSLDAQMPSSSGSGDQVRVAELGFEQAEASIVSSAEKMFIMYHQLEDNVAIMENNHEILQSQLELTKYSLQYGLAAPSAITELEGTILELQNNKTALIHQKDSLLLQFKSLTGLSFDDEVEFGEIPEVDLDFIRNIDFKKDLDKALKNSLSIKTKKAELGSSSGKAKTYELQIKEMEVTQNLSNQYQLLIEKQDALKLSQSKLASLNGKLLKEEMRFNTGLISRMELLSIKNEVETQKNTVKTNSSNLFLEIENYKAMVDGMI